MRCLFLFYLLSILSPVATAQLSQGAFINSAQRDPEVVTHVEQTRYLSSKPWRLSPLQRLEFRMQNRELMPDQQEFALRVTPANPWEIRNNSRYFKSFASSIVLEGQQALKDALWERYNAIVYYVYYAEVTSLMRSGVRLIEDQLLILQSQSGSRFFDADDFVDLQLDLMERTSDLEEAETALTYQLHVVEKLHGEAVADTLMWTSSSLPGMTRVRDITDSLSAASVASLALAYQQSLIDLAENEYKLEKANINVGFLQTEFDNRRVEQGRTPINLSLGLTIPIVNPNKGDMTKRRIDAIDAKYDYDEIREEEELKNFAVHERLNRLIRRYQTVENRIVGYETGQQSSTLTALEGGDPRIRVKFNENLTKLRVLLAKIRRDTLLAYVEYLYLSDHIQQQPLVNFLSSALEKAE